MSGAPALPDGFVVELDAAVRHLDGGRALLGGSPPTLLRLAPRGRELLRSGRLTVDGPAAAALARTLLDAGVAHPRPRGVVALDVTLDVTVVVPVRDDAPGLARLLVNLDRTAPGVAVVVVDDGSHVPLEVPVEVHLVRHARSRGPAAARNTGLAEVGTPAVVFLDADVAPRAGWLAPLLAHLQDPAVALVAPRITADPGIGTGWVARYETVRSSLDLGRREAPVKPRSRVAYVPSAAVLLRVAAVRALPGWPGFDEGMPVAEDVDLCWRLHAHGGRLRYEPAACVDHRHRTRARPWLGRKLFYGTGAAALARRHPGQVPPVALAPWTAAACALALTGTRTGLAVAGGVTAAATVRLARRLPGIAHPGRTAVVLAPQGLYGAGWQLASAAWRHWWPAALVLGVVSRRARRTLLVLGLAEGLGDWVVHRGPGGPGPVVHLLCKRADDLAYGTGLWVGCVRQRSAAALRPHLRGS